MIYIYIYIYFIISTVYIKKNPGEYWTVLLVNTTDFEADRI
jgi:hypothetical protein